MFVAALFAVTKAWKIPQPLKTMKCCRLQQRGWTLR